METARWNVESAGNLDTTWLEFSSWGWQVATVVTKWLQMCEWPTDNSGPNGFSISISWAEVFLQLVICWELGSWLDDMTAKAMRFCCHQCPWLRRWLRQLLRLSYAITCNRFFGGLLRFFHNKECRSICKGGKTILFCCKVKMFGKRD